MAVTGRDEVSDLLQAIQAMNVKLREVVGQVVNAASNVSAASKELSASAEQLSQGSTQQAASTEEASASMEEMAAIREAERRERQPDRDDRRQSAQDAEASGIAVGRAVEAMQTIAQKITIVQEIARPDRPAGAQRRRRGGPGRELWPRLRGGGQRGAQARRAQPGSRGRDRYALGRHRQGRPAAGDMLGKLVPDIKKTPAWSRRSPPPAASRMSARARSTRRSSSSTR